MSTHSFKFKMAFLSAAFSGLILLAFTSIIMTAIERFGLQAIDRELQALGDVQARVPRPPFFWSSFDEALSSIYGGKEEDPFLVKVNDSESRSIFVSSHWPEDLTEKDLGEPECRGPAPLEFMPPPHERHMDSPNPIPRFNESGEEPPALPPFNPSIRPHKWRMTLKTPRYVTVTANGKNWRFAVMGNEDVTLMLGMNLEEFHKGIERFWKLFLVITPLGLLLLAIGGWWLANRALQPVNILTDVASGITAKGLDQRVRIRNADREFRALIDVINGMLDRLEKSFQQAARFSADAAHELKTPLTILQGRLEEALHHAPLESPDQRNFAELLEEVERLKVIVRKLLLLSQADAGQLKLSLQEVDVSAEIQAVFDDTQSLAEGLTLNADLSPNVSVMADTILLRQALQNLASNAIKYNRPGGWVDFTLRANGKSAIFELGNSMDPAVSIDRDRLFVRFYRADQARGRKIDGAGLGLSLAREIVRAHRGELILKELTDDRIVFSLTLPCQDKGRYIVAQHKENA